MYSNKTLNAFLIYTTPEKAVVLYEKLQKFKPDFKSMHKCEGGRLILLITLGRHRVSAIKNFCGNFCTVSFLLIKGVIKIYDLYLALTTLPFEEEKRSRPQGLQREDFMEEQPPESGVSWRLVGEFACSCDLDDPYIIMGHYLDFATNPQNCEKCKSKKVKAHYEFHASHYENALLFYECKQQKNIAQHAADVTIARHRVKMQESTRSELLEARFNVCLARLKELSPLDLHYFVAGMLWYKELFYNIEEQLIKILQLLTENVPKHRNILFKGPVNTGKTSLAAAIIDLVGGRSLNINCPAEKLPFELGCAIDQFAVIFEDVKGQQQRENLGLPTGQGMSNLDNLRDHLDGAVKVNLERKHVNKRSQIFPPCIVTCNEYFLPRTLLARFSLFLPFREKPYLRECLDMNKDFMQKRILQDGLTIFLLLLWYAPVTAFLPKLQPDIQCWKEILQKEIPYSKIIEMQANIMGGNDPMFGIVIEDTVRTESTEQA